MEVIAVPARRTFIKLIAGFVGGLAALIMITGGVGAQSVSFPNSPTDCNSNAVINCGALTTGDVVKDYQADNFVQKVYQNFNISNTDIQNLSTNAVAGTVTKTGDVIVNGKTVATGAVTAGRTSMPGSTAVTAQGATFYKRPTSVSFQQDNLDAYVVMDSNGQFRFAILASCGNPVNATPVAPPAPTPQPTTPANAECTSLNLQKVSDRTYTATVVTTTSGGASLQSITYDFGDGSVIPPTSQTSFTHTYQQDGNFTVTAKLTFSTSSTSSMSNTSTSSTSISSTTSTTTSTASNQNITANCQAMVTVTTPTPPAATVATPPKVLPNTGTGNILGLFAGISLLGASGYRFYLLRHLNTHTGR